MITDRVSREQILQFAKNQRCWHDVNLGVRRIFPAGPVREHALLNCDGRQTIRAITSCMHAHHGHNSSCATFKKTVG
jgi:hypothetical protein